MIETFQNLNITNQKTNRPEDLLVGNLATVKRPEFIDRGGCLRKERILLAGLNDENRAQVNLNGWNVRRYQLVAMAWHGYSMGAGFEIHHIDGDETNDAVDNLIAVTKKEHARIHRLIRGGHGNSEAVAEVLMDRGDDDLATEAVA